MPHLSARPYLLVLALAACTGRPADTGDTASGSTTGSGTGSGGSSTTGSGPGTVTDPTTTSPGTTTTATTTATETTASTTVPGSVSEPSTGGPGPDLGPVPCDPWEEDCPEGQKCAAYSDDGGSNWNATRCVPIVPDPAQVGEPCDGTHTLEGLDNCDKHLMCFEFDDNLQGECVPLCTGSPGKPGCDDPDRTCALTGDGVLILCLGTCDPLVPADCDPGTGCVPFQGGDAFVCVLDASMDEGQALDECEFVNDCDPGLACLQPDFAGCDPMLAGCCTPYCDLDEPPDCPVMGQQCVPWFEDDAPPKYADLGVCGIP